ncbi:MAG: MOSC domain-containing protein [Actinomycetes bacterium]
MRANLLVDTGLDPRFDEDDWVGRTVRVGADVLLRVRAPMTRCVMVNSPQVDLPEDGRLLTTLGEANDTKLGLVVDVLRAGVIPLGDAIVPEPCP